MAYMDCTDPAIRCLRKAVKFNSHRWLGNRQFHYQWYAEKKVYNMGP